MRPEGFSLEVGTRYKLIGEPNRHWRGFVECEMLEARQPTLLRYSWVGDEKDTPTEVTFRLEARASGTRLTFSHTGFTGLSGFFMTRFIMGPGWKKMMSASFPAVLDELEADGTLRQGSSLKPKF
jgi:uncharacterized protein YndB with AHSA1/START domain